MHMREREKKKNKRNRGKRDLTSNQKMTLYKGK